MSKNDQAVSLKLKNLFRDWWISLFVSFIFLRLVLAVYWDVESRFWLKWQRIDVLAIFLVLLGISLLLLGGYTLLSKLGKAGRFLGNFLFVAFTIFYFKVALIEVLYPASDEPLWLAWLAKGALAAVLLVFFFFSKQTLKLIRHICLLFSPILLIFFGKLVFANSIQLVWSSASALKQASPHVTPNANIEKVVIFLFDGMSYHRTFLNGLDRSAFPNLARVAETSVVFENAYSSGNSTLGSVPGLLAGMVGRFGIVHGRAGLKTENQFYIIDQLPNLFQDMQKRGFNTFLQGTIIPYHYIIGTGVDVLNDGNDSEATGLRRIKQVMLFVLTEHLNTRVFPLLSRAGWYTGDRGRETNWRKTLQHNESFIKRVEKTVQTKKPLFLFAHFSYPHAPCLYDRDAPVELEKVHWEIGWSEQGCINNLYYADTVIGRLLDVLEKENNFDKTLFIITSDHSERSDPWLKKEWEETGSYQSLCRVPLLMHFPGQKETLVISGNFMQSKLREGLLMYLDQKIDEAGFINWFNSVTNLPLEYQIDEKCIFWGD